MSADTTDTLSGPQARVLMTLAKAKGPLTRGTISERCFNGNSVNFVPILNPMVQAGLLAERQIDVYGDGSKIETVFAITPAGRERSAELYASESRTTSVTRSVVAPSRPRGNGPDLRHLKVGDVITKVYRDVKYEVTVRDAGFEYRGRVYGSLTAVAKVIRGSDQEVNGWAFFGQS